MRMSVLVLHVITVGYVMMETTTSPVPVCQGMRAISVKAVSKTSPVAVCWGIRETSLTPMRAASSVVVWWVIGNTCLKSVSSVHLYWHF